MPAPCASCGDPVFWLRINRAGAAPPVACAGRRRPASGTCPAAGCRGARRKPMISTPGAGRRSYGRSIDAGESLSHMRRPRILIADDQPDILGALKLMLSEEGFDVTA